MQQIYYQREKMNHYMVIDSDEIIDRQTYATTMLEVGNFTKFMNCEIRELDGEQHFYYKLKYRTSLKQVLGDMPFTYEQIQNMLCSVVKAMKEAEEYLLPFDYIVWRSDSTFVEVSSGNLLFICYPADNSSVHTLPAFLMEILQYVHKESSKAYMYLMGFYNLVTNPDCTLETLEEYVYRQTDVAEDDFIYEKETKKESGFFGIIVICIVNIIVASLLLLEVWSYQSIWVLIVTLFLLFVALLMKHPNETEDPDKIMEEYFKENVKAPSTAEVIEEMETTLLTAESSSVVIEEKPEELCLISMEPKKRENIILYKDSIVLGSMKVGCDYTLAEKGMSRIHAKIIKKEDGLYLMDLNSTNGTFLNDGLVVSGREHLLAEGDVVSFANLAAFVVAKQPG